jgi:hypothetical protein
MSAACYRSIPLLYDPELTIMIDQTHVRNFTFMWPCIVTNFLIIKPTRCTNSSNLFWKWNSTCFGQFLCPSSGVIYCTLAMVYVIQVCRQLSSRRIRMELQQDQDGTAVSSWSCSSKAVCMTYTTAECTVNNSWWWTEELSATCTDSFPKQIWEISASSWFYYKEACKEKLLFLFGSIWVNFLS